VKQSEVHPDRLIEEFLELVQVDSISGKERQLADLLIRKLTDLGRIRCSPYNFPVLPKLPGGSPSH
jgi:hypothetical protein